MDANKDEFARIQFGTAALVLKDSGISLCEIHLHRASGGFHLLIFPGYV